MCGCVAHALPDAGGVVCAQSAHASRWSVSSGLQYCYVGVFKNNSVEVIANEQVSAIEVETGMQCARGGAVRPSCDRQAHTAHSPLLLHSVG